MVAETCHKGVPGITLDNMWRNCGKMNAPPRLIAAKKSRGLSHGETFLQLIVDVGPGRVLDHLGPRCFAIGAIRYNMACATKVNHQLQPRFWPLQLCLDAISALVWWKHMKTQPAQVWDERRGRKIRDAPSGSEKKTKYWYGRGNDEQCNSVKFEEKKGGQYTSNIDTSDNISHSKHPANVHRITRHGATLLLWPQAVHIGRLINRYIGRIRSIDSQLAIYKDRSLLEGCPASTNAVAHLCFNVFLGYKSMFT